MGVYWVTSGALLAYLVLVWFLGAWLPLHGSDRWVLRGGLALIGILGAGAFLWFYRKSKATQVDAGSQPGDLTSTADIDLLVHEALRRLKSSTLGRGATLRNLPLVFLVGDSGATKTTTILHSALEPELLAGHVYQDNNILPTRLVNIWYTKHAIFLDPAGNLLAQPPLWKRLVRLVQPARVSSAVGRGQQAPRAAIVCFDCGNFLQAGASESTILAARKLAARLQEVSQLLSISFPVYVLFTKVDRVSFFSEFVRGLSAEETSEVFGTTLPVRKSSTGVYAEEETRRLTNAFDELFYSLAERRLDLLAREFEVDKLPGIYEFPRELRKLRAQLVQFLVDLARPSQLSVNPFLRGFYFSGVRPVIVNDVVPAAPQAQAVDAGLDSGATRIFTAEGSRAAQAAVPMRAAGSRKIPQWVFLTRLFNSVIVQDRVALATSGFSTRVNVLRRVALGLVALAGVVCAVGFFVSFVGNRKLEGNVKKAAREMQSVQPPAANQLASLADLQKLDQLRRQLVQLSEYKENGVPWSLRWGLYVGDRIYPDARKTYFRHFAQLLFRQTQGNLLNALLATPDKPGPNDKYETVYNELKAYLITTSNPDKSTKDFLTPQLMDHWSGSTGVEAERRDLAKQQFDFYSSELAVANPYLSENDRGAIQRSRNYLAQFPFLERFYSQLLTQGSAKFSDVSFNEKFPDSVGTIISTHRVRGAFTRNGFGFVQDAIRNPSNYMGAEEWVLGKPAALQQEQSTLQQKLNDRYYQDFITEWRTVLQESKVAPYKDLHDADQKLDKLTSPTSPLLELLWFVSNNTDVDAPVVANPFQTVRTVEPPGPANKLPEQYVLPANAPYVEALAQLRKYVNTLLESPTGLGDVALINQVSSAEGAAEAATRQVIGGRIDQSFHTEKQVYRLLDEPITHLKPVLPRGVVEALNAAGQQFCAQFAQLSGKYPFNPKSPEDLPIEQFNSIFAPKTGALWTFYDKGGLKQYLPEPGPPYRPVAGDAVKLNPAFVRFFDRAAALSKAMYGTDSSTPRFSYTLREMPSNVEKLSLRVGNKTLSGTGTQETVTWTGADERVEVVKGGETLKDFTGPWSVFRFVLSAPQSDSSGTLINLEWKITQNDGSPVLLNNKPEFYRYQLQVSGFNPFRLSDWPGPHCISQVAH